LARSPLAGYGWIRRDHAAFGQRIGLLPKPTAADRGQLPNPATRWRYRIAFALGSEAAANESAV
jgi:hypothetical protein